MEKHLEQGTPQWLEMRKSYLMASDAPVVMGVSPWKSKYQLWQDKLGLSEAQKDNWAMKRGRELEPIARDAYQEITGNEVEPKVVFHESISFMGASLDGISADGTVAVEIKCPGEKDHLLAKDGIVPEKYAPQLQHQLEVIGINMLHYFSYRDGDTALIEVSKDDNYIKKLCVEERRFWKYVQDLMAPPLSDKDFEKRRDTSWMEASQKWKMTKSELDKWKDKEEQERNLLINLASNKNSIGNGVQIQRSIRKGMVDYSAIPELKDVDLDKYRKKAIEAWRINLCQNN